MKSVIIFVFVAAIVSAENSASSYETNENAKKQGYSFESSYDNNSRSESSNGKVTTGSYRVPLPDGRVQIVTYRADKNGYFADVKYEGEAKYPEYKPASSYSAPAYKPETVPVVITAGPTYKFLTTTTSAPTTTTPAFEIPAYVEPTYTAPTTTTPATTAAPTYEDRSYSNPENVAPVDVMYKVPAYVAPAYVAPTTTAPESYAASTTIASVSDGYVDDIDYEEEAQYPIDDIPAAPTAKTPNTFFVSQTYKTPVAPAYGIRYIGDIKQYEDKIKYPESKVYSSPAYKSTFFVFPKHKVSSLAAPLYEKTEVPANRTTVYSIPVAPVPLAFRALYAIKDSNKIAHQSTNYKEPSYVAHVIPNTITSAYSSVYTSSTTTTPAYNALTTAAPVYSASSSKAPEYEGPTTSAPIYKPSTFFASNKDYISPGYKELSRIFRETSLTAGNRNWDNFFNKAWEFAKTKY